MSDDGKAHLFKKYWAPVALYAGFIFYLSSLSSPVPAAHADLSVLHVPLFFLFSYITNRALIASSARISTRTAMLAAIAATAAYGILDEFHQLYVPGRAFSYYDMGLDFIGGCLIVFKDWWEKLFERVNL